MKIDQEFKGLIPPLAKEEYTQLEANILAEGCRDALVLWGDILIDGHNRYEICLRHGLGYKTVQMQFENREKAKEWIVLNQFGRRNLSPYDRSVLALRLKELFTEKAKESSLSNLKQHADVQKSVPRGKTVDNLAKIAGVSRDTIQKVETIEAKATPKQKERLKQNKSSINAVYKEIKRVDKKDDIKQIEPRKLRGKYNVLYADPPWQYDNRDTSIRGTADDHYPTMALEEIKQIPVQEITLDNAALFLWTTSSMIKKAFDVMEAWGFEFKTSMVWVKDRMGTGFFVRSKHEILLIGTRGSFTPMTTDLPESVVFASREGHSKKPEVFYEIIEKMYPEQKYIELFARGKRDAWSVWGNEV